MSTQNPVERIEAGLEQLRETIERLDRGARTAQERVRTHGDALAKDAQERAQRSFRETRDRAEALRSDLSARLETAWTDSDVSARWETLRKNVGASLQDGLKRAVDFLPIASQREVERVNRKLNTLQRKIRKIEKQA